MTPRTRHTQWASMQMTLIGDSAYILCTRPIGGTTDYPKMNQPGVRLRSRSEKPLRGGYDRTIITSSSPSRHPRGGGELHLRPLTQCLSHCHGRSIQRGYTVTPTHCAVCTGTCVVMQSAGILLLWSQPVSIKKKGHSNFIFFFVAPVPEMVPNLSPS